MLGLVRHLFYDSRELLAHVFFNAANETEARTLKSQQGTRPFTGKSSKSALAPLSDKLVNLFAQILEELGPLREYEPLMCECLLAMITFASQSIKFKNAFLQAVDVSTQSRRVTLLRVVCEHI